MTLPSPDVSTHAAGLLRHTSRAGVTGILLAAGRGERFGGDKLLARGPDGKTLIETTLASWLEALNDVVVVVRRRDQALVAHLGLLLSSHPNLRLVINENADEGMASSIASGVAVSPSSSAWMIGLGDMPWMTSDLLAQLRRSAESATGNAAAQILVPSYAGTRGHPVVFGAKFYGALLSLTGDRGARSIIDAHPELVQTIAVDNDGVLRDVDFPSDWLVSGGLAV